MNARGVCLAPDEEQLERFLALPDAEALRLLGWIDQWLIEKKTGKRWSSYYLKHVFEDEHKTYVEHGVFQGALLVAGITVLKNTEVRVAWLRGCNEDVKHGRCQHPAYMGQDYCRYHLRVGLHRWRKIY